MNQRCFIKEGDETDRIRAGGRKTSADGSRIYTDSQTGDEWQDALLGLVPSPAWSGLVRFPRPDTDLLFALCRQSDDFDEVAAALCLQESVDTRSRLLDLLEELIGQASDRPRIDVLLKYGAFEFPSGHQVRRGMAVQEIERQYALSKHCAERSTALRRRLNDSAL